MITLVKLTNLAMRSPQLKNELVGEAVFNLWIRISAIYFNVINSLGKLYMTATQKKEIIVVYAPEPITHKDLSN